MADCAYAARFRRAVNMSPAEIRAWRRRRRKSCSKIRKRKTTGKSAVDELSMVARMLTKPSKKWTQRECAKAKALVGFIARHRKGKGSVCSHRRLIALRDWAYHPPRCNKPKNACKTAGGKG